MEINKELKHIAEYQNSILPRHQKRTEEAVEIIARDFDQRLVQRFSKQGIILYKRYIDDGIMILNRYVEQNDCLEIVNDVIKEDKCARAFVLLDLAMYIYSFCPCFEHTQKLISMIVYMDDELHFSKDELNHKN